MLYVIHYCIFFPGLLSATIQGTCPNLLHSPVCIPRALRSNAIKPASFSTWENKSITGCKLSYCTALHFGRSAISLVLTLNIRAENWHKKKLLLFDFLE